MQPSSIRCGDWHAQASGSSVDVGITLYISESPVNDEVGTFQISLAVFDKEVKLPALLEQNRAARVLHVLSERECRPRASGRARRWGRARGAW